MAITLQELQITSQIELNWAAIAMTLQELQITSQIELNWAAIAINSREGANLLSH